MRCALLLAVRANVFETILAQPIALLYLILEGLAPPRLDDVYDGPAARNEISVNPMRSRRSTRQFQDQLKESSIGTLLEEVRTRYPDVTDESIPPQKKNYSERFSRNLAQFLADLLGQSLRESSPTFTEADMSRE